MRKTLVWGGIALIIFFVAFKPGSAGAAVSALGQTVVDIFEGVGKFFSSLVE